jgi:glycosyltransferase involved in cell wall biosynthesis
MDENLSLKLNQVKIFFLHNTMAPYRHVFFEELNKLVDLHVFFISEIESDRAWQIWPKNYSYKFHLIKKTKYIFNRYNLIKLLTEKPDIIVISGYNNPINLLMLFRALLFKIPFIYWTEGIHEPNSLLGLITRPLRVLFVKKARAIIVPGKISKKYVFSLGADFSKIIIASNIIDNKLFFDISNKYLNKKEEIKEQLGLKNKLVILYVGQLIKRKGVKYLLYAYEKLKNKNNIALILIGSGDQEKNLKLIANSISIKNFRIFLAGMSMDELIKFYSISDIFVLPTLEDIWGFVINEAMACKLPIISTNKSQAAQEMILPGENGYIIKAENVEELSKVLDEIIINPELRLKMGELSKEILNNNYNVHNMTKGFISAIEYCLKKQ